MKPQRIQRKRTKGWRMPANTVSVGRLGYARPGPYGNPFVVGCDGTAEECVAKFRAAWERSLTLAEMQPRSPPMPFGYPVYLGPLRGKNLACWCKLDQPCHADVLLELANAPLGGNPT